MFKRKWMSKALSLLLIVSFVVTYSVPAIYAEEHRPVKNTVSTDIDAGIENVTGGNSFSNMLMSLNEEQMEDEENKGRFITDISIKDKKATVQFFTEREAELVVGVYTDASDSERELLGSGKAYVYPEDEQAELEINIDEMPEYYVTAAFLLDPDTHEPFSEEYINRLNTKEVRDILEKGMDDYEDDLVVDLDDNYENRDTNYAVINEQTKRFETSGEENKVTGSDEQGLVYAIENASAELKALKTGDPFVLDQGDNDILVGIVKSIQVDGNTVTITTDPDAEMKDIFEVVEIDEETPTSGSFEMSEEAKAAGLSEITDADDSSLDLDVDVEGSVEFGVEGKFIDTGTTKLSGGISGEFNPSLKATVTPTYQYIKADFAFKFKLKAKVQGSGKFDRFTIGKVGAVLGPVFVGADIRPKFEFKGTASMTHKTKVNFYAVLDSEAKKKLKINCGAKNEGVELSSELEFFFGLGIAPNATVISENVAKIELDGSVGLVISAKNTVKLNYDESTVHTCGNGKCIDGTVDCKMSLEYKFEVLKWLEFKATLLEIKLHICDFYYSITFHELGGGTCPHKLNKVTLSVIDVDEKGIASSAVSAVDLSNGKKTKIYDVSEKEISPKTGTRGKTVFYLPDGKYRLKVTKKGYKEKTKRLTLDGSGKEIEVELKKTSSTDPDDPDDPDEYPMTGYCGMIEYDEDGDEIEWEPPEPDDGEGDENIEWTLEADGTLTLSGDGAMRPYGLGDPDSSSTYEKLASPPWKDKVKKIVFEGSITRLGYGCFADCDNLVSVTLPDTLTDSSTFYGDEDGGYLFTEYGMSSYAFQNCDNLQEVVFPENSKLQWTGWETFGGCRSLSKIKLPDSIKYINRYAFHGCSDLQSIEFPEDLHEIGPEAFRGCSNLTSVVIPEGLQIIWGDAFLECDLRKVTIPQSVKRIGGGAFGRNFNLEGVWFKGDAPSICTSGEEKAMGGYDDQRITETEEEEEGSPFDYHENGTDKPDLFVYTLDGNSTWTDDVKSLYEHSTYYEPGDETDDFVPKVFWKTWTPSKSTSADTMSYGISLMSSYEGDVTENEGVLTSSFTGLVPGEEYVLAVLKDEEADDIFDHDNLLYIWQDNADDRGKLSLSYRLHEVTEEPFVVLYGAGGTNISELETGLEDDEFEFDGSKIVPEVYVLKDDVPLEEGLDYEITGDTSAVYPGTYSVTVTMKGDCYGSRTLTYVIDKGESYVYCGREDLIAGQKKKLEYEFEGDGEITFRSSDPSVVKVDEKGILTAKKAGRAEVTVSISDSDNYYGESDYAVVYVNPKAVKLSGAKNVKGRKIKTVWKKGSGITGYELQYSIKKNFKGAKTKNIKKAGTTKYTLKKLKKKKTYYVRVRAYKKIGGTIYRSKWSNVKKVKIKK